MDTNVKQYITCRTTRLVFSADLEILLLALLAKSSITFRPIFSDVATDNGTVPLSNVPVIKMKVTAVYFTILRLGA